MSSKRHKTKRFIAHAAAIAMAMSTPLSHANVSCVGPIAYLGADQAGNVVVAVGGTGINVICSTTTQGNNQANTQACKMFYATLLSAQISGHSVQIYYNDPALTACSQIASWSTQPSAYFVNPM